PGRRPSAGSPGRGRDTPPRRAPARPRRPPRRRRSEAHLEVGAADAVVVVAVALLDQARVQRQLGDPVQHLDAPAHQHVLARLQVVAEAPAVGELHAGGGRGARPVDANAPEAGAVDELAALDRAEALVAVVAVARLGTLRA